MQAKNRIPLVFYIPYDSQVPLCSLQSMLLQASCVKSLKFIKAKQTFFAKHDVSMDLRKK